MSKQTPLVADSGFQSISFMTDRGIQKLSECMSIGKTLKLTHVAVGDGNGIIPIPKHGDTALIHEVWRGLAMITADPRNDSIVRATAVIPVDIGGFSIRETGVFDVDGELIAVCNMPGWPKIAATNGIQNDMTVGLFFAVSNDGVIELVYDPNVIGATIFDIIEHNQSPTAHPDLFDKKVDKITGKSLLEDTEIARLKAMDSYKESDLTIKINEINVKISKRANGLKFENENLQLLADGTAIGSPVKITVGGHFISETAPANTKLLWIHPTTHLVKYYDGTNWVGVTGNYG